MKKLISIIMALVMCLAMSLTVLASDNESGVPVIQFDDELYFMEEISDDEYMVEIPLDTYVYLEDEMSRSVIVDFDDVTTVLVARIRGNILTTYVTCTSNAVDLIIKACAATFTVTGTVINESKTAAESSRGTVSITVGKDFEIPSGTVGPNVYNVDVEGDIGFVNFLAWATFYGSKQIAG